MVYITFTYNPANSGVATDTQKATPANDIDTNFIATPVQDKIINEPVIKELAPIILPTNTGSEKLESSQLARRLLFCFTPIRNPKITQGNPQSIAKVRAIQNVSSIKLSPSS
ncbi:hypothetical protein ALTERO38_50001 [Alteromonas sp. 38]|nr:hypothetical protein ALTER154_90247 [Alteromonas sp. 154]VXB15904.1 hypothetical protein ALTERO38_50001 [Alteromonas sp. 38]